MLDNDGEDNWDLSCVCERDRSVTQDHEGEEYSMYNKKEEGYLHFSPLA
jgi:hypothetical protein